MIIKQTMRGALYALATVIVWSLLNVVNRFCILKFDASILVFTGYMIFASGISLMLIRRPMQPQLWKNSVRYSWLYTVMQILENFFMIYATLYITSTDMSLLFNIEVILTFILTFILFKRIPRMGDYLGSLLILVGSILFIRSLPQEQQLKVGLIVLAAALASCIRSIVIEKTTMKNPTVTVRQKCGTSGYTLCLGGLFILVILLILALLRHYFFIDHSDKLFFLSYVPSFDHLFNPYTVVCACLAGFFINAVSVFMFYTTLRHTTSVMFMAIRALKPGISYGLELIATLYYATMNPQLATQDVVLGAIILLGTTIILLTPMDKPLSRNFMTQ